MAELPDGPNFYEPSDLGPGVYANQLAVWYSAHEFSLDFAVLERRPEDEDEQLARIVARVHVPPTKLFGILKTLRAAMTGYEEAFGEIQQLDEE